MNEDSELLHHHSNWMLLVLIIRFYSVCNCQYLEKQSTGSYFISLLDAEKNFIIKNLI